MCTPAGPLACAVEVGANDSDITLSALGTVPFPRRYRARSSSGTLVFDAAHAELEIGDRLRLTLHRDRETPVPRLGVCDVAMPPPLPTPPTPAHGCARCDAGEADMSTFALVAFVLALGTWRRRRSS